MKTARTHYYTEVPDLGNVAVSRHAQERMDEMKIPEGTFVNTLYNSKSFEEQPGILWREGFGIRIVILERPEPFRGAMLVKTVFRIQEQMKARKR